MYIDHPDAGDPIVETRQALDGTVRRFAKKNVADVDFPDPRASPSWKARPSTAAQGCSRCSTTQSSSNATRLLFVICSWRSSTPDALTYASAISRLTGS